MLTIIDKGGGGWGWIFQGEGGGTVGIDHQINDFVIWFHTKSKKHVLVPQGNLLISVGLETIIYPICFKIYIYICTLEAEKIKLSNVD